MRSLGSAIGRIGRAALCGGFVCALSLSAAGAPEVAPEAEKVAAGTAAVGRVVSVRGAAYAQAPGQERRILSCRDFIFEGDRVMTQESSALGVISGDYYTRLNQSTQLTFASTDEAAPKLDLEAGHVRLLDASGRAPAQGEIATPGLVATRSGRDTEAMVFVEKAGVVSMVCAFQGDVKLARRTDPSQTSVVGVGNCVVSKPREALYGAEATHPRLAVLMQDACESEPGLPVAAGLFSPAQVALGPAILGVPSPDVDAFLSAADHPNRSCALTPCPVPRAPAPPRITDRPPPFGSRPGVD
jgi:hypothetical protein